MFGLLDNRLAATNSTNNQLTLTTLKIMQHILGIDVGASGIKGAVVDVANGKLKGERFRVPTPQPSTPKAMAGAFSEIVEFFNYKGPVGC
mgnify:CR=1 FL=1